VGTSSRASILVSSLRKLDGDIMMFSTNSMVVVDEPAEATWEAVSRRAPI